MSKKKELWTAILVCLIITNICWYVGYSMHIKDEGNIAAVIFIYLASFMPAITAVIICKKNKEKVQTLLINPNIKKSGKIYLIAILTSLFIVYASDLLPLLFFPNDIALVPENLTIIFLGKIIVFTFLSTIESIGLLGEELGWMGYFFPGLEKEYGTFPAIFMIAIIRTLWHLAALILMGGVVWFSVLNLFVSNFMLQSTLVYVTKKSNSVFPAAIVHAITNILVILSFVTYSDEFYNANLIKFNLVQLIPIIVVGTIYYILLYKDKKDMNF